MKKYVLLVSSIVLFGLLHQAVFAITTPAPTQSGPTPTPVVSTVEQQINNLKDRIASRVAQLNLVEKKGIIGTVSDVSETQITVTDIKGDTRLIDVDELTKFSSPSAKSSFGISDITKGSTIGVIGLYNKDSRRLLARFVDVLNLPQVITGGILAINKDNFTFTLTTVKSDTTTVSVEDITKTLSYTNASGLTRSGFSKLAVGQRVFVVGFPDATNANTLLPTRVVIFPELPMNPRIPLVKPEDITPITSSGSGKKLTPIVK